MTDNQFVSKVNQFIPVAVAKTGKTIKRTSYDDHGAYGNDWNREFHANMMELTKTFRYKLDPRGV